MSSTSAPDDQWTLDEATSREQQRRAAIQRDAPDRTTRYQDPPAAPGRDTPDGIHRECKGCGGHVGQRFVRVMGHGGRVYACPGCADSRQLQDGAAAGFERRTML